MSEQIIDGAKTWAVDQVSNIGKKMEINVDGFEWFNVYNNRSWKLFVFINGSKAILFEFPYEELETLHEKPEIKENIIKVIEGTLCKWKTPRGPL